LITLWGRKAFRFGFEFKKGWIHAGKEEGPREVKIKAIQSACSSVGSLKDAYVPDIFHGLRLGALFWIHGIPGYWYRSRWRMIPSKKFERSGTALADAGSEIVGDR